MAIPSLSKGVNSWLLSTTVVGSFALSANVGIVVPVTLHCLSPRNQNSENAL